ncbi:MAG: DeoR family transcriptional regulator [Patescibacteria group bacterium]|nr:DeoR family transcriptional regulator [Patescibacteria group bacterium]
MALNKDYIIKLTLAVYQVTGFFPENEPLQHQIRQKANNILADFINIGSSNFEKQGTLKEIQVVLAYFSIAKQQNWVDIKNFLVLSREYKKIRDYFSEIPLKQVKIAKKPKILVAKEQKPLIKKASNPNNRQEKIIKMIEDKGEISLIELRQVFSGITSRTLRRDLRNLADKSKIKRIRTSKEDILFVPFQEFDKGQIVDKRD